MRRHWVSALGRGLTALRANRLAAHTLMRLKSNNHLLAFGHVRIASVPRVRQNAIDRRSIFYTRSQRPCAVAKPRKSLRQVCAAMSI